jgi:hypothetical protein
MLVHMVTTSAMGYTVVLHIDLYKIFPALVILPLALIAVVVHFVLQSGRVDANAQLSKMLDVGAGKNTARSASKLAAIAPYPAKDDESTLEASKARARDEAMNAKGALNTPVVPINKHISRRASAVQGIKVLDKLRRMPSTRLDSVDNDESKSSDRSCSDESDASSGDDMEEISKEEQAMAAALQRERTAHARATMLANAARTSTTDAFVDVEDLQDLPEEDLVSLSAGILDQPASILAAPEAKAHSAVEYEERDDDDEDEDDKDSLEDWEDDVSLSEESA